MQLADLNYMRKGPTLFMEFAETGVDKELGYQTAAEFRAAYPTFFWKTVSPYIGEALNNLRMTQEGKQWVATLYSDVCAQERHLTAIVAALPPIASCWRNLETHEPRP